MADDQEGMGERGGRVLRPAGAPPEDGEVVDGDEADDDGTTGTSADGGVERIADLRLAFPCWLQTLGDGMDPSLNRASAGDSFGYLKA